MIRVNKVLLRKSFKLVRNQVIKEDYTRALNLNAQTLLAEIAIQSSIVGTYWPKATEFRPPECSQSKAYPFYSEDIPVMEFRRMKHPDTELNLVSAPHGIRMPGHECTKCIPSVVLVPLLCFDTLKHRVGYGGGYYDRLIRWHRESGTNTKFVGIGLEALYLRDRLIATNEFDEPLDYIITEKNIFR